MPIRQAPRHAPGAAVICSIFLLCGCSAFRGNTAAPFELSRADREFAQALAHYSMGLIYEEEEGRGSQEAIDHFADAAALDPKRHQLHARVAMGYLAQKQPDKAIGALLTSSRQAPHSAPARIDLATAYQIAGKLKEAIAEYRGALEIDPSRAPLYLAVADLYFQLQQAEKAIAMLDEGFRKSDNPGAIQAFCYTRGLRFIQQKQPLDAIPCFRFLAERQKEEQGRLYHLIGELYEIHGTRQDALDAYALACQSENAPPQSFIKQALLQLQMDQPDEGIATLKRGSERHPQNLLIMLALGQLYSARQRLPEAIETFRQIETLVNRTEGHNLTEMFYLQYGAVCEQAGMTEEAERVLGRCIEIYPDAHEVLNYLAYMWAEAGVKLDQALDYIGRALALEPDNAAYLDTLGWIHFKRGDFAEALIHVEKAAGLLSDPTIAEHLGDVYHALGRREEAIRSWTDSFLMNPASEPVARKLADAGVDVDAVKREAQGRENRAGVL